MVFLSYVVVDNSVTCQYINEGSYAAVGDLIVIPCLDDHIDLIGIPLSS